MAVIGEKQLTGSKGLVKKDVSNQKNLALGFKKLRALNKPGLGATGIDFTNLTTPSEAVHFTNPSSAALTAAQILAFKNNVIVKSSSKGELIQNLSFRVASNSFIEFLGFTAEENEIFEVIVDSTPMGGVQAVDSTAIVSTGVLPAGAAQYNVGEPFALNAYPTRQLGAVLVFLDGVIQLRNSGNTTAAPGADGNYQETGSGTLATSITFNVVDPINDRTVVVVNTQGYAERPDGSMMALIEQLQATVDVLVEDAAVGFGNPETRYQPAPTQPDLKAFGDRVYELEQTKTKYQIKNLAADVTAGSGNVAELAFTGLTVGKTYRVTVLALITSGTADGRYNFRIINSTTSNTNVITLGQQGDDTSASQAEGIGLTKIFTAVDPNLNFEIVSNPNAKALMGDASGNESFMMVEELPNHEQTAEW